MNIFILDEQPILCAQYHCDRHVVKMILETSQMLCTTHHLSGTQKENIPYRATHTNHPCNKWMRQSLSNYIYSLNLARHLSDEYTYRYGKVHLCLSKVIRWAQENKPQIPDIGLTPFAQAMPDKYKNENAITAYRSYYNGEKRHLFSWTKREIPKWIEE